MAEVEEPAVMTEAKAEDTPNEEKGGDGKTEEIKEKKEAKEAEAEEETKGEEAAATEEDDDGHDTVKAAEEEAANEEEETNEKDGTVKKRRKKQEFNLPARESKRARKSVETFVAENFIALKEKVFIAKGRGSQLGSIPNVKESIESYSNSSDDLAMAHKLLFSVKGKGIKLRKDELLGFSGYLAPLVEGEDKQKRADLDEKEETKMSVRAYKLSIPALKRICDVFDVDRTKKTSKDNLIDCLLDFLGKPDIKLTNAKKADSKTKAKSPKLAKKKQKKAEEGSDEEGSEEEEESNKESEQDDASEDDEKGKMPSDKALRKWVRAYVSCFNLEKVTTKHALETVSDRFGVDLSSKKDLLKDLLTDAL